MSHMNETIKSIMERYSCRDFSGAPLTDDQVKIISHAALAAPSAMNAQPWHIIVITDKALIDELDADGMDILNAQGGDGAKRMADRGGKLFYNAPCLVIIAQDSSHYATVDCGIATQNVSIAAHALGLGNVICGMARIPICGPKAEEWAKRLKIPEGYSFGMSVCIGAAQSGKEPHELNFDKLTII